ncbi:hypothetical protein, conserved [Plasmodium gonderi]|uniref:Uncharacterized protein n=1 Tax=Plasmodium gonderi TaxID=77519 RepID=A0A1Y1JI96_PLAGO|nr:hypothetical protein, conserved [Plasmodium gonderi]GAW81960.1 hypothetical protein, conserved [Plasmodium gonderi]
MKLSIEENDSKNNDILWESLYNDFNEITNTNKKHCNNIENSLYNFCKGVSSSNNLSYNLKKRTNNESLFFNYGKEVPTVPTGGRGEGREGDTGETDSGNMNREMLGLRSVKWNHLNSQLMLNKKNVEKEELEEKLEKEVEVEAEEDEDEGYLNNENSRRNRQMLKDFEIKKSDLLKKHHSTYLLNNKYYDGDYVKNNYLQFENDYLKNETYVTSNDIINSDKTRSSEYLNSNNNKNSPTTTTTSRGSISKLTNYNSHFDEQNKKETIIDKGKWVKHSNSSNSGGSGGGGSKPVYSHARNNSMFNLMKYKLALKGLGIDKRLETWNNTKDIECSSNNNIHNHVNNGGEKNPFSKRDEEVHHRSISLSKYNFNNSKELFKKREEDFTYLLNNKKIYDNVEDDGRGMLWREYSNDYSALNVFHNYTGGNGGGVNMLKTKSIFNKMKKYRNFNVKLDQKSCVKSDLKSDVNFTCRSEIGIDIGLDMNSENDSYKYDDPFNHNHEIHHDEKQRMVSYNSLEKLDQLLKNKCKYMNSSLSEIDFFFRKQNKLKNDSFKKSFMSCDNYKIDSVISETLNRTTELDKSESSPMSEQMDEISNHNQLISRSKELIERSKKCLGTYSEGHDKYAFDDSSSYPKMDKTEQHGNHNNIIKMYNISNDLVEYAFPPLLMESKKRNENVATRSKYNLEYNFVNEIEGHYDEQVLCDHSYGKTGKGGGARVKSEQTKENTCSRSGKMGSTTCEGETAEMNEQQNSKSVNNLFEAYDKEKISDVNISMGNNVPRQEGTDVEFICMEKKKNSIDRSGSSSGNILENDKNIVANKECKGETSCMTPNNNGCREKNEEYRNCKNERAESSSVVKDYNLNMLSGNNSDALTKEYNNWGSAILREKNSMVLDEQVKTNPKKTKTEIKTKQTNDMDNMTDVAEKRKLNFDENIAEAGEEAGEEEGEEEGEEGEFYSLVSKSKSKNTKYPENNDEGDLSIDVDGNSAANEQRPTCMSHDPSASFERSCASAKKVFYNYEVPKGEEELVNSESIRGGDSVRGSVRGSARGSISCKNGKVSHLDDRDGEDVEVCIMKNKSVHKEEVPKTDGGGVDGNYIGKNHVNLRKFIMHPDFVEKYSYEKKEKVPYEEEMKISDGQQKALDECYDMIKHSNDVKRLFREKNFLQDLCEKRKILIQKSKIENMKLNVEIKSLLSYNNNLSYALKEKDAEIKILKKQKEELEMNLMKRINNNGNTHYSPLTSFTTHQNFGRNGKSVYSDDTAESCKLLSNRNTCSILNNLDHASSIDNNGGTIKCYEERIQELLVQVKMYQTQNSDLQEQLRIFMSD